VIAYFNGRFLGESDVRVSPWDRGFQFADGVYEVVRAYRGRFFRMNSHMRRLRHSLDELRIGYDDVEALPGVAERLLRENGLTEADGKFYVQVTRGVAPRSHRFPPATTSPTVFASVAPISSATESHTAKVILTEDTRWARRDIKSLMLLPNVLASQAAADAGADEALFVRQGMITEGSHTGFAAVRDGVFRTHPSGSEVLPSITREVTLELCEELGVPVREEAVAVEELSDCQELMILGTTAEVSAVVAIDGRPIAGPGPITSALQAGFSALVARELGW
jgi:D-alanine transaminase